LISAFYHSFIKDTTFTKCTKKLAKRSCFWYNIIGDISWGKRLSYKKREMGERYYAGLQKD
jgi:hypothetical protein